MEKLTKAVWLFRFGKRLMVLHPSMTASDAAQQSVEAFRSEPDMWPERAAERVASASQPAVVS